MFGLFRKPDPGVVAAGVEVIAWDEAVAMLPPPEPMPWGM